MIVYNFYQGKTFLGKGLVVTGFDDCTHTLYVAYIQNRLIELLQDKHNGFYKHVSTKAEFIRVDEWDHIIQTSNGRLDSITF